MKVPKIIGLPPAMMGKIMADAPDSTEFEELLIKTCEICHITPGTPVEGELSEGWKFERCWEPNSKDPYGYVGRMQDLGIDPLDTWKPNKLSVAFQHTSPVSETYSNNYSQNSILAGINNAKSEVFRDAASIFGGSQGSVGKAMSKMGISGDAFTQQFDKLAKGKDINTGATDKIKALGQFIGDTLKKPEQNIDFPMMWRGSSYEASHNIMIRLSNPFPGVKKHYDNNIVAPLLALLQFVCPRSDDGRMWTAPFIMKFEIPGRVKIDAAYCSNLSVVKGGDVNDIGWNSKSNIVDINMTISPVHSVKLNSIISIKKNSDAPSLQGEVEEVLAGSKKISDLDESGSLVDLDQYATDSTFQYDRVATKAAWDEKYKINAAESLTDPEVVDPNVVNPTVVAENDPNPIHTPPTPDPVVT
jgi:hypothetical protein